MNEIPKVGMAVMYFPQYDYMIRTEGAFDKPIAGVITNVKEAAGEDPLRVDLTLFPVNMEPRFLENIVHRDSSTGGAYFQFHSDPDIVLT